MHSLSASATWPGGGNHWTQVQWITAQTPVGLGSKGTDGEMRHCPGLGGDKCGPVARKAELPQQDGAEPLGHGWGSAEGSSVACMPHMPFH